MDRAQFVGCIVGLAVGDAMGYPAEFRSRAQLLREVGPEGITGFLRLKDPRFSRPFITGPDHPPGTFTDDTQMTLAVAEALLSHGRAGRDALMQEMGRRFVAWHRSPGELAPSVPSLYGGAPYPAAAVVGFEPLEFERLGRVPNELDIAGSIPLPAGSGPTAAPRR